MNLDKFQKEQFISYWGRCPMIDTESGQIITVEDIKKVKTDYVGIGYKWLIDNREGYPKSYVFDEPFQISNLEKLEPFIVPTGYYQLEPAQAYWISRKTDRNIAKGMTRNNTEIKCVNRIMQSSKSLSYRRRDFLIQDITRIFHGLPPVVPKENRQAYIDELFVESMEANVSFCLSKNVCLVNSEYGIPAVLYKLNPVGYYYDKKIHIFKEKEVSKELIKEETDMAVEIYAE